MAVRKGQMMISGLILLGIILATLSLNISEFNESESGNEVFTNIEQSIPNQVKTISEKYSGHGFVENFQALSYNYRDRVSAAGSRVSYTVIVGERSGRSFNVYTGNFGSEFQDIELEVNNETQNISLRSDEIVGSVFSASDGYSINIDAKHFSQSFEAFDNSFVVVHYRFSSDGVVRQDTYIG